MKFKIKTKIMQFLMEQHKKKPFNVAECDVFQLPADADTLINNSYYFGGNTSEGQSLIMRIAFRNTGFIELFVLYKDSDGRFLTVEKQQYPTSDSPLKVTCTEPGKKWNLLFDGIMVEMTDTTTNKQLFPLPCAAKGKPYHCTFNVDFTATLDPFSALHHSDFRGMAEAFAREKWNKEFFKALSGDTGVGANNDKDSKTKKKYPQLHYEQTGHFNGTLTLTPLAPTTTPVPVLGGSAAEHRIPAAEHRTISMTAARDHSFGKRDWNFMNDHIWLLLMTDAGEVMNFSIVNYPHVKRIFCGYTNFGEEKNLPLTDYRITTYNHEKGEGSDSMTVECTFDGGKKLTITSHRRDNIATPFDNGNYYFQEGIGDFIVTETTPDGETKTTKARGSIEYGFNKDASRWDAYM